MCVLGTSSAVGAGEASGVRSNGSSKNVDEVAVRGAGCGVGRVQLVDGAAKVAY